MQMWFFFLLKVKVIQNDKWLRWIPKGNHFSTSLEYKLISKLGRNSAFEVLYSKCCSFNARYPLCIHVYMIPTTNKIIQLSPYGLQQAITILLTMNLTIYHIAQVLHFFVDESLEKKTWPSRRICQTQKNTSQESLYLNETKYVNTVLNTFTNKCCNFGANQKCQMVASWDQKLSTNNSCEQNTNQESTETNQQQPTDITQKITNAHEQHELPMNLKWTQVVRKCKQFLPIAIHLYMCPSSSLVEL